MLTPLASSRLQIDEQLVQTSGKFLILDRMLPALKKRGHKVKQRRNTKLMVFGWSRRTSKQ